MVEGPTCCLHSGVAHTPSPLLQLRIGHEKGWEWAGFGKRLRGGKRKTIDEVRYHSLQEWYDSSALLATSPSAPGLRSDCARTRLQCVQAQVKKHGLKG